jgi:putative SOS response-associated peptidase YedK
MCGRYTLSSPADLVAELFGLEEIPDLAPRYNIAPTQNVPVVRIREEAAGPAGGPSAGGGDGLRGGGAKGSGGGAAGSADGGAGGSGTAAGSPARRRLDLLRWGLVPYWADDPGIGNRMINARAETVAEKPAFRDSFKKRRCLVVADGFYEWKKVGGGLKQPYRIRRRDRLPFAFAGLWDRWRDRSAAGAPPLETFTILTTAVAPEIAELHDRMPVILEPAAYDLWLDRAVADPGRLAPLLRPRGEALEAYPVSRLVNNPANESPDCLVAVTSPPGPGS